MGNRGRILFSENEYRTVEKHFKTSVPIGKNIQSKLRGVLIDSLNHPGSLIRGQLAYKLMVDGGTDSATAKDVAIAMEYFHLASLIFDDLSCMDNADYRRGQLCVHKKYGEAAAILGALAFINHAYSLVWAHEQLYGTVAKQKAVELLNVCLGPNGILNGQAHDLYFSEEMPRQELVTEIAKGKTVNLIRLSLLLPAILSGADTEEVIQLNRVAHFSGLAYQIMDDFKDVSESIEQAGKSTDRDSSLSRPNYVLAMGWIPSFHRIRRLEKLNQKCISRLQNKSNRWVFLMNLQVFLHQEIEKIELLLSDERKKAANQ